MLLTSPFAFLGIKLGVAAFASTPISISASIADLPLRLPGGSLPATGTSRASRRRCAFLFQQIDHQANRIECVSVASIMFTGSRTSDIERKDTGITHEIGDQLGRLARLELRAVDEFVRSVELDAVIESTFSATFNVTKINDCRAIAIEYILPGPVSIITALKFL